MQSYHIHCESKEARSGLKDLPKKSFFVKYGVCRHIDRNKKVWMGIKMNKTDVTGRKML